MHGSMLNDIDTIEEDVLLRWVYCSSDIPPRKPGTLRDKRAVVQNDSRPANERDSRGQQLFSIIRPTQGQRRAGKEHISPLSRSEKKKSFGSKKKKKERSTLVQLSGSFKLSSSDQHYQPPRIQITYFRNIRFVAKHECFSMTAPVAGRSTETNVTVLQNDNPSKQT
ncbi:hypothetical protein CEXT_771851 [Caerostris extrusa]|uniref:Uncharacterized protein n=1 Tax=Caerostris extrusa TaxID=172846 RepID=A0AAV4RWB3_CAEEX|nr:hypothetical protein CEXT_771851 [Caerostris extrusa]